MAQRRMGERVGERERVGEVERQGSHGGGGRGVSRDGGGGGGRDSGGRECVACSVSCSIDASVASVAAVAAAVADCVAGGFASRWLSKCSLMKAADTCAVHTGQRTYRGDSASLARFRISHFAEAQNRILGGMNSVCTLLTLGKKVNKRSREDPLCIAAHHVVFAQPGMRRGAALPDAELRGGSAVPPYCPTLSQHPRITARAPRLHAHQTSRHGPPPAT